MMSKRKQRMVKKLKEKEYSKAYRKQREARFKTSNHNQYPWSRMILIRDFFRTPDFYKALFFFFGAQIMLTVIGIGVQNPDIAGLLNLVAIVIGLTLASLALKEITKRQRQDNTRRKLSVVRMVMRVSLIFSVVVALNVTMQSIGVQPKMQANQTPLDTLYSVFPIATILAIVVVSPIVEELVFRELLPYATGPSYISFISSSVLFIVLHTPSGVSGWVNYGILSSMFLYARLKDNNIYSSIGIHSIWNLITVLI